MTYALPATKRTTKGIQARRAGGLPAIVYGPGGLPEAITLNPREFDKLYRQAGEASLIDLLLEGAAAGKILIQEVQHDPVNSQVIHVDLRRIDMNKPMTATVELRFTGEAPVVKKQGGTVVTTAHQVEVKCLPKDLVSHLDVSLAAFTSYETVIKVKDLALPPGLIVLKPHPEDVVAKAARALTEEEIKKLEEAAAKADVSKIEMVEKKKKEEEAAAEAGAAPEGKEAKKEEKPAKGGSLPTAQAGASGGKEEKK